MNDREIALRAYRASNLRAPGSDDLHGRCLQKLEEIYAAICYLKVHCPTTVLEIGSATGGTFLAWCSVSAFNATLVSIDIQQFDIDIQLMKSYLKPNQKGEFIRGDSTDPETLQQAIIDYGYDFLFIDGDHSEEYVRADWNNYHKLVKSGGLVGFHDICDGGPISLLWEELAKQYPNVKFIEDQNSGWGGIGFLRV